jgi:hypothetical protein
MRHSLKVKLGDQKKLTMRWSSMITKTNHSNNSCKRQIWTAFLRSHLTFRGKTQNTLLAYPRSKQAQHSLHESFIELHQVVQKEKIAASEKAYNRHVLEEKQFTDKTSTFIHYRLFFQKYEHDSIISWSQTTRSIHSTRLSLYSSRLYRCTSERFRARLWL